MEKATEKTRVIFRKFKDNELIAIFPEELGTINPNTCMSYMHIGQHGSCEPDGLVRITMPVNSDESEKLFKELVEIGYELEVVKKNRHSYYFRKRLESLKNQRGN